jgi:hypothetical protein
MSIKIAGLIVVYGLTGVALIIFLNYVIAGLRGRFILKFLRNDVLTKEDIQNYKEQTKRARRYVNFGGILVATAILLFVLLAWVQSVF